MTTPDRPSQNPLDAGAFWGDTFLNRFEWKVRNCGQVKCPDTGEEIRLKRNLPSQFFRRAFGEVIQFNLTSSPMKRPRLHLAAICLREPAKSPERRRPAENLLRQISGAEGLDFKEERFYCTGIFSPGGWPEEWTAQAELQGNALFYLVEKGEGTCWRVFGPKGPLRDLFDPESAQEKTERATKALGDSAKLVLPGDQAALDPFLEEQCLDRAAVESAIKAGPGRYQIIEHKGKSYIQRSVP